MLRTRFNLSKEHCEMLGLAYPHSRNGEVPVRLQNNHLLENRVSASHLVSCMQSLSLCVYPEPRHPRDAKMKLLLYACQGRSGSRLRVEAEFV